MASDAMFELDPQAPMSEEEYDDFVTLLGDWAPHRFVLIGVADDRTDAGVLAWGLAWDDQAIAYSVDEHDRRSDFRGRSAEAIRAVVGRRHEVRLAWIDSNPCTDAGPVC